VAADPAPRPDGQRPDDPGTVDVASEAFAGRLATLLREHRRAEGIGLGSLARRSDRRFTTRELRAIESGRVRVADATELAELYGADLASILPVRMAVAVDPAGQIITAGVAEAFEPADTTSMLTAYLRLIRRLRGAERDPVVALRRDDVDALAAVLDEPGERVIDRLGELMGATQVQRKVMVGLFVSGAVVVGLAVTAVAATTGDSTEPPSLTVADTPDTSADTAENAGGTELDTVLDAGDQAGDQAGIEDGVDSVFLESGWSGPVPPAAGLDVSPLPSSTTESEDESLPAPSPSPTPVPTPPPATEPDPEVEVGPPPVPVTTAPVVEPAPVEPAPTEPAPIPPDDEPAVAVGSPPVPTTTAPLP